jgi:hypothetical protein
MPSRSDDSSSGDASASDSLTPPAAKAKFSTDQQQFAAAPRIPEQPSDSNSSKNPASDHKGVKVNAAIHNERLNSKDDFKPSENTKSEKSDFSHVKLGSRKGHELSKNTDANKVSDFSNQMSGGTNTMRSSSSDHQMAYESAVSASEVTAALLGVSASTQSINNNITFRTGNRHRRCISSQEEDLSSPYNHYRCLSPSDHQNSHNHFIKPHHGIAGSNRFLKRQFSLDRGDEPSAHVLSAASSMSAMTLDSSSSSVGTPRASSTGRLFKQNSAGAAHDLERIEEIPLMNTAGTVSPRPGHVKGTTNATYFRQRCELPPFSSPSISVSVESLN